MEDKNLSEKESLELITRMIKNTQSKFEMNAGVPFLIFGYLTVIAAVAVWFAVTRTGNPQWNFLWFIIIAIGYPVKMITNRKKVKGVKSFVDGVITKLWIVFGVAAFLVSLDTMFFYNIDNILFIIVLLMGMGTALTGMIIRFSPSIIAGFASIAISFLLLQVEGYDQCLIFAAVFVLMMVIPGHILNCKGKKDVERA
ncbi:MAG: hypothetical protein WCQ46_01595 [Bacteroidales bacterium]